MTPSGGILVVFDHTPIHHDKEVTVDQIYFPLDERPSRARSGTSLPSKRGFRFLTSCPPPRSSRPVALGTTNGGARIYTPWITLTCSCRRSFPPINPVATPWTASRSTAKIAGCPLSEQHGQLLRGPPTIAGRGGLGIGPSFRPIDS